MKKITPTRQNCLPETAFMVGALFLVEQTAKKKKNPTHHSKIDIFLTILTVLRM